MRIIASATSIMSPSSPSFHRRAGIRCIVCPTSARLLISVAALLLAAVSAVHCSTNVVQILNKNGQLTTSSTLVWQTFSGDEKQLEHAVPAGQLLSSAGDVEHTYAMYVCRAQNEGIFITGHTSAHVDGRHVCMVSMHANVKTHHGFELLLNKGLGAKLRWKPWNKFSGSVPRGAVSAVSAGHTDDSFVARRAADAEANASDVPAHHHHGNADYWIGRLDPTDGLGKVFVIERNNERRYEDGEILTEAEPVRYELRDIKMNKWRTMTLRNRTVLGSATLVNDADETARSAVVSSIISYTYDRVQYWGTLEGVSRGIPTDVYESGREMVRISWGLRNNTERTDTKAVNSNLPPGTALNATILANYTKIEAPYRAKLVAFFDDSDETLTRHVESTYLLHDMLDLKYQFSPIYWQHNQSLVPTTTTTTTTTTSTTSSTTSSTTTGRPRGVRPAMKPPTVDANGNRIDDDADDVDAVATDDVDALAEDKYTVAVAAAAAAAASGTSRATPALGGHWQTIAAIVCLVASCARRA